MMDLIEDVRDELIRRGMRDECMVKGCNKDGADAIEVLTFDPIEHDNKVLALCDGHMEWAEERNELAAKIHVQLREYRKELGKEHYDDVQRLAKPDGEVADEILMGEYETIEAARRDGL